MRDRKILSFCGLRFSVPEKHRDSKRERESVCSVLRKLLSERDRYSKRKTSFVCVHVSDTYNVCVLLCMGTCECVCERER